MQAKESIDKARDFYLTLLDKFPTLIWRSDINAKCDYFNQTWLDFTGRSMEQEMGDGWSEGVHPEDLPDCLKNFLKGFHARQPFVLEYRLRRHDGEYRWILDQGRAFNDLDGQFAGYMGSCFDITEAKRTEQILRESEEKFRQLADNITDVFWMTSPDLKKTLYVSPGYELIWGHSPESLYAHPNQWLEAILPEQRDRVIALVGMLRKNEPMVSNEYQIARPDGTIRWVHDRGFQVRDAAGNLIRLAGIVTDITERKQAEEARRNIETRFRRLVDSNVQGVIFANMKGEITQANDAFLHMVGYTRADLAAGHLNWVTLSPPEYAAADRHAVAEMAVTGVFPQYEKEYLRKDGTRIPVLIGGASFEDNQKEGVAFVIDLTERKQAEEALKNSHTQLRALSGRLQSVREEESERIAREIHDELGQALTGLNMDLIWIQQKLKEEKSSLLRSQFQRRIKVTMKLLETTVRSVQRISAELRPAMLGDLGLTATLEWQAEEFEARTGIRCRWKPKPITVQSNHDQATALFRIFQEILTNVARHARARSVSLKLVQNDGELILEVMDNGRGFNEKKLLDHKSLGLLGMRERAAFIGGRVEIRSAPGKGTKVIVTAPITATGQAQKVKSGQFPWQKN